MSQLEFTSTLTARLEAVSGSDATFVKTAWVSTGTDFEQRYEAAVASGHAEGLIRSLIKERHGSPFEHTLLTFAVECPIFAVREWHRHRIGWSYNEMSGRYSTMEPRFYVPGPERPVRKAEGFKPMRPQFEPGTEVDLAILHNHLEESARAGWKAYQKMLQQGMPKELARLSLPLNLMTRMYATCNVRSLMAFLSLRVHDPASRTVSYPMWEINQLALQMEEAASAHFPIAMQAFREFGRVAP